MSGFRDHWTCSKFADWLRGTPSLLCGTSTEWKEWRKAAKAAHPVRYWLADTGLDRLQDFLFWIPRRHMDVWHYIRNRFIHRTHLINIHYGYGHWFEADDKILYGMFSVLVDYVEIECAAMAEGRGPRRSISRGMERLNWEAGLAHDPEDGFEDANDPLIGTPTPQAVSAREIIFLYKWWKETRPARKDPYDAEWREPKESDEDDWLDFDTPMTEAESTKLRAMGDQEEADHKEDEDMLIRLVKVRRCLWT